MSCQRSYPLMAPHRQAADLFSQKVPLSKSSNLPQCIKPLFDAAKGDTRAVYHVRLLNRLIVGRVLFPAAGMVPTLITPLTMHASVALPLNRAEQVPLLNNVQVFLMRGISAVTHPDLVKEKLDRPWIRSVLAQALREHDGMRRWPNILFQTKHHSSKLFSQAAQSRDLRHGQMGPQRGLLFPSPPLQ
jgi:hypothetical protein